MRVLITGICGFAGSIIARGLADSMTDVEISGVDSFVRPGSETNRRALKTIGVRVFHADIRNAADFEHLPRVDWVIDAAANPSVLAGVDGATSSRQLVEHNLIGTLNILEMCRRWSAGLVLLSTSRVYSIQALAALPTEPRADRFELLDGATLPAGVSPLGVSEGFSVAPPVSLYGATKLASETLALEYGDRFAFPVWINRCGVLAGAGQFGRIDQGIFSFWIHSHRARGRLEYVGFGGTGHQVRDCLHPRDLLPLLIRQMTASSDDKPRIVNVSGGRTSVTSLRELTAWCDRRFGSHAIGSNPATRAYHIPWLVLDSSQAAREWGWTPQMPSSAIFEEIACHAEQHPDWLDLSAPR